MYGHNLIFCPQTKTEFEKQEKEVEETPKKDEKPAANKAQVSLENMFSL